MIMLKPEPGNRVWNFDRNALGRITAAGDDQFTITYEDGDRETVKAGEPCTHLQLILPDGTYILNTDYSELASHQGERIQARFALPYECEDRFWYDIADLRTVMYRVTFQDGTEAMAYPDELETEKSSDEIDVITKRRLDRYCLEECGYLDPDADDPCVGCKVRDIIESLEKGIREKNI